MNILWISFYGSWTKPLINTIKATKKCKISVIVPSIGSKENKTEIEDGVTYYYVSFNKKECYQFMTYKTFEKYKQIIKQINPDIIHVHGTEKNLAQIQNFIQDIPIVTSIQGLLIGCMPHAYNFLDKKDVSPFKTLKNILGWGGFDLFYKYLKRGLPYEKDILSHGKYFFGRTSWDKAYIYFHNANALYFQGEELLRDEFYRNANSWNISKCKKHTIFTPFGFSPNKGLHLAIEAVYLLKKDYPDINLIVPGISPDVFNKKYTNIIKGEEYLRYVKNKIDKYQLQQNITFLPRLNAFEMIKQMQQAHTFLSASSIENSSNIIGEVAMIGTPIVTTPVGGIISFMKDNDNSLFTPAGDPYMMAYQIKTIFENDSLAMKLSQNAYKIALERHDKEITARQYTTAYEQIIKIHPNKQ